MDVGTEMDVTRPLLPPIGPGSKAGLTGRLGRLEALLKETDQRLSDFTAKEADRILRQVRAAASRRCSMP